MWKFLRVFNAFIYPEGAYRLITKVLPFLIFLSALLLGIGLYGALYSSPPDYQQGEGVRIIYVHVPCAMLSMFIFGFMACSSACFLIWKIKLYDIYASAAAPIGAAFTFLALLTGSLWGKPMWGTWWIWDARLTSELILLFIYLACIFLRKSLPSTNSSAKVCAMLAVVGAIDLPIIHYSVKWWHTLHQGSTLTLFGKPSISPEMLWPLLTMILAFGFIFMSIFLVEVRTSIIKSFGNQQWFNGRVGHDKLVS